MTPPSGRSLVTIAEHLPLTTAAIHAGALLVQAAWVEAAQSGRFFAPGLGTYARSISVHYPEPGNPFAATVINTAETARVIEDGAPAFHLPQAINWGSARSAKTSAAGQRYLRVPFRHSVPRAGAGVTSQARRQMMPPSVYQTARALIPGQRVTARPTRGRAVHASGMAAYLPKTAANVRPGVVHASIHEGMRKQGATGHTQYMAWRTITENSPGWHIPARRGTHIAATVAQEVMPKIEASIGAALEEDLVQLLRAQLGA